jgi:hypothetical protein
MHKLLLLTLSLMACTPDPVASREPAPARAVHRAAPTAAPLLGIVTTRAPQTLAARLAQPLRQIARLVATHAREVVAPSTPRTRAVAPSNVTIRFAVPRDRRREVAIGAAVEVTVVGNAQPLRARVASVSNDLGPPLDFALAEAEIEIVDAAAARDIPIGTHGDLRTLAPRALPAEPPADALRPVLATRP